MTLASDAALAAANVSRETEIELKAFESLVQKWSAKINLVSRSDLANLWERHILDSVQVFPQDQVVSGRWVDLGSGGGFPAIVVAILAKSAAPELNIIMIESDQRKAAFLRTAIREFSLNATVIAERIETVPPLDADFLSARALSPLTALLEHVDTHLNPRGKAFFLKGRTAQAEIVTAREDWAFDLCARESITDPESVVLTITGTTRARL